MKEKILVIAAHPDDDVLGCGGFLAKNRDLSLVRVIFIAEGSSCRFVNPDSDVSKKEIRIRNQFALNSLKSLGIEDVHFFNLPCGRLDSVSLIDINKIIEEQVRDFKPDTVFTHSSRDLNNDHVICYKSTMIALRPSSFPFIKNVFCYEVPSSSDWNYLDPFQPNFFLSLQEEHVHEKWNALAYYETEISDFPHPRSRIGIENLARQRGMQCGSEYAEAYELVRGVRF